VTLLDRRTDVPLHHRNVACVVVVKIRSSVVASIDHPIAASTPSPIVLTISSGNRCQHAPLDHGRGGP
jgi:hypothetical protein